VQHVAGCVPWDVSDVEPLQVDVDTYAYSAAPNIVFVLIDDWGWNDMGVRSTFMNWTTPHIDNLYTNEAISLTNYYSNELCSPSRASLLTGEILIAVAGLVDNERVFQVDMHSELVFRMQLGKILCILSLAWMRYLLLPSSARRGDLDCVQVTIAQELKSAGYRTYMVGKWVSVCRPFQCRPCLT
jgi:arylsulfatase A-like enzyme